MLADVPSAALLCVSAAYVADQRVPRGAEAQSAPPDNSSLATFRFTPHRLCALHHISDSQHHISIIQILFVRTRLRGFVPLPDLLPHPLRTTRPLPPLFSLLWTGDSVNPVRVCMGRAVRGSKQPLIYPAHVHVVLVIDRTTRHRRPPRSELLPFESSVSDRRPPRPGPPPEQTPLLHALRTAPALSSAAPHPCAPESESNLVHQSLEPSLLSFPPY